MAAHNNSGMIDGFHSVQAAARRAAAGGRKPPGTAPPPPPPTAAAKPEAPRHIGHTVMPTRHDLVCYGCGYAFPVTGRLDKVFCPKCREQLECGDITIEGAWTGDCRTVGTLTVTAGATVTDGTLTATCIAVAGDVRKATLNPTRRLELDTGARIALDAVRELTLGIRSDAELSFDQELRCRDLDVFGNLCARVFTDGTITLHPGSRFSGELHSGHLIVHEGAALRARMHIQPRPPPQSESKSKP